MFHFLNAIVFSQGWLSVLKVYKFKILGPSVFVQDVQLFIIVWLIYKQFKAWIFETVFYVSLFCFNCQISP